MAESTRGWTDSKLQLIEIQLLDRVHQADWDGEAGFFYAFAREVDDDWELIRAAADTLVAEGLINGNPSHSGTLSPTMTPAGTSLVLERRERRSDPRKRAIACREALLDWSYGHNAPNVDEFAGDVRAYFEGDPFSHEEIIAGARDLIEKGFITGRVSLVPHGVIGPQITATGRTIVESYGSSIASHENRSQPASVPTVININTGRITGQLSSATTTG